MALLTFILLTLSAFYFYKWSERNYLSLAFSLMTFSMGLWSALLVLSEIPFPLSARILIVNLIPIPPLFIPILLTYVIFNYTKPYALVFPPTLLMLVHVIAILFFSWLALEGSVSPFRMAGTERVFDPGSFYYPSCAYIYASILICAGILLRNIFIGDYFVRLHSIYLFTGVVLGGGVSSIFVVVLPLFGISLTSMAVLGVIVFLWFAWIPVTKYRLFNIELTDFKQDFRNPRLSSAIISINRFLLNKMDPKAFKEICDQFEIKRQEEIFALQSEMLIESVYMKKGGIADHVKEYSKKVINIFFR